MEMSDWNITPTNIQRIRMGTGKEKVATVAARSWRTVRLFRVLSPSWQVVQIGKNIPAMIRIYRNRERLWTLTADLDQHSKTKSETRTTRRSPTVGLLKESNRWSCIRENWN